MPRRKKNSFLIEVLDEQDYFVVDLEKIKSICEKILDDFTIQSGKLGVILVDSDTIHQYNRDFLKHDYPTDVISFPLVDRRLEGHLEAEILACTQVAQDRAPEFGWSPEEELLLYIVHGTLHLVGFNDTTPEAQTIMQQKERDYLAHLGITVPKWNLDDWDEPISEN
ncbi:MAG: rRNA maturation RNase YbeY [Planctomycetaceae bacterium]|jgi:probable rRNA maturation factor|nr:rRNA maturation RNase YbeY [Planctomycetaceae bacterium]